MAAIAMDEPAAAAGAPVRGYIDGCWDIMHSGHFNAIRQAKSICDVLVVGVHSDSEIEENKALPVMRQQERYALLEHVKWIDEILHDVPYSPQLETLDRARAHFCIHGDDMPVNAQGVCAYDEMKSVGRLRLIRRTEGVSTTDIIGKLITLSRHQHGMRHAWEDLADSDAGVKLDADVAIKHYDAMSSGSAGAAQPSAEADAATSASSTQMAAFSKVLSELSSSYAMSSSDVERLKAAATSLIAEPSQALQQQRDSTNPQDDAQTSVRVRTPVQLLASTRRITQFASGRQPSADDKVVYVCGSFDMFHVGHAQFLKDARERGSFLLVGIYEDLEISRVRGANLPVMSLNERVLNVCACKWVDEVIIGAPRHITEELLKSWSVAVVARGTSHRRTGLAVEVEDNYDVAKRLGKYSEVPSKWPELCHETIVERIVGSREVYINRNKVRARREEDYYATKNAQVDEE